MSLKIESPRPPQIQRSEPRLEKPKPSPARLTAGRVSPRRVRDGYERPSTEPKSRGGSSFEGRTQGTKGPIGMKPKTPWEPSKTLTSALDGFIDKLAQEGKVLSKEELSVKLKDFLKEQRAQPGVDKGDYRVPRRDWDKLIGESVTKLENKVSDYSRGKFSNGIIGGGPLELT